MTKKTLFYSLLVVGVVGLVSANMVSAQNIFHNQDIKGDKSGYEKIFKTKAEFFGMTIDDLKTAREEGKTFYEIAEEQDLNLDEFKARLHEKKEGLREQKIIRMETHFNELVANGKITQEQADEKLQMMSERFKNFKFQHKGYMDCSQCNL